MEFIEAAKYVLLGAIAVGGTIGTALAVFKAKSALQIRNIKDRALLGGVTEEGRVEPSLRDLIISAMGEFSELKDEVRKNRVEWSKETLDFRTEILREINTLKHDVASNNNLSSRVAILEKSFSDFIAAAAKH